MEGKKQMIPIGIENFAELREKDFYFVDKTCMIRDLLESQSNVTLFTRPRRFGKSLSMSMLAHFFSMNGDKRIFDGLEITKETELCAQYMGKYPVIVLSLKGIDAPTFDIACQMAVALMIGIASRFYFLRESENLSAPDRQRYENLINDEMRVSTLTDSLRLLCELLEKHFGAKVVLLIDEYDIPLAKAHANGYYDQMVFLLRGLLGNALKTNDSLAFAVLTGCLRVSKESIFTGLNNLAVVPITDELFSEYFGFTDGEVRNLLGYYGLESCYGDIRQWYDGYRFGNTEVYCPWDVLNHCRRLLKNPKAQPQNYWANSSGNDAVREFVRRMDTASARQELQTLVDGGTVRKRIRQDLTYRDMYDTTENLWSLLYMTGYLTSKGDPEGNIYELSIPNREVRCVFQDQVIDLFYEEAEADGNALKLLCQAISAGDAKGVEDSLNGYLRRTVSIRDTAVPHGRKENFYHGLLLGLLQFKADWNVTSNYETGNGYGDILVRAEDESLGVVIEVKCAHDGNLEKGVQNALRQIEERRYADVLREDNYRKILKYGVSFHKKQCRVRLGSETPKTY